MNNVIDAFPNQIADRLAAGLERRGPGLGRGADGGLVRPLDGEDDLRVFVVVGFEVEVEGDFFFDACLFFSLCSLFLSHTVSSSSSPLPHNTIPFLPTLDG